jgi:ABC-type uncharacterized transport system permease subunit
VQVLQGIIILFVAAESFFKWLVGRTRLRATSMPRVRVEPT